MVGPLEVLSLGGSGHYRSQLVLWPNNDGEAWEMDLVALEKGWVEVISEAR